MNGMDCIDDQYPFVYNKHKMYYKQTVLRITHWR